MECHKCPNREKVENGEFAQLAYSDTPCAKCHLNENSDLTMEFHVEMGDVGTQDPRLREQLASASGTSATSCLLYTSPSPRDRQKSRMPSSA